MPEILSLLLRFERATASDQAYVVPSGALDYLAGGEDDLFNTRLDWTPELLGDLLAVGQPGNVEAGRRVGARLRALLPPQLRERLDALLSESMRSGRPARVTLRSAAAEIYALPWELLLVDLRDGPADQALGQLPGALLRYAWPRARTAPLREDPKARDGRPDPQLANGRVLFAWSDAGGAVPAEAHAAAIAGALPADRPLEQRARVSFAALGAALQSARPEAPITALHLLCHGVRRGAASELLLQGEGPGQVDRVDAERLRGLLAPYADRLRLVVLCACHGGDAGEAGASPLGSIAQELHKAGLAVVVASRLPLSRAGSSRVAAALWGTLLGGPSSLEDAFLAARAALSTSPESTDRATLQLYSRPEDGEDSRPFVFRPYRGLRPFTQEHSRFFFGRDAERAQVLQCIDAGLGRDRERIVVVAGASGSGKTSLLLGGVIPDLKARPAPWDAVVIRPVHPGGAALGLWQALRALRRAHAPLPRGVVEPPPPNPVSPAVVRAEAMDLRAVDPAHPLLVVADGFEEVFTTLSGEEHRADREAFIRALWDLARQPGLGVVVALSMRIEFLARTGEISLDEQDRRLDRFALDPAHVLMVREMGREGLEALIVRPAERVGLTLEDGLVDRLLQELGGGASALPLLQFMLDELWHVRVGGRSLTLGAYQDLGGLQGALARAADAVFEGLDPEARLQARRLLVRMVWVGNDGSRTRRRVNPVELRPAGPERAAAFDRALDAFTRRRLLTRGDEAPEDPEAGDWAELAHEALLRGWARLGAWVSEDEVLLRQIAVITRLFEVWSERREGAEASAYLLHGPDLGYAMKVLADHPEELPPPLVRFIGDSERAEIAEQSRKRRAAWAVAGLAVAVALIMTLLAGVIERARAGAEAARRTAMEAFDVADKERAKAIDAQKAAEAAKSEEENQRIKADQAAQAAYEARDAEAKQRELAERSAAAARAARGAEAQQTRRARDAARLSAARLVRASDPTTAAVLLAEIVEPAATLGWRDEALRALAAPLASASVVLPFSGVSSAFFDESGQSLWVVDAAGAHWRVGPEGAERLAPPGGEVLAVSGRGSPRVLLRQGFRALELREGERLISTVSPPEDATAATLRADGSVVTGSPTGAVRVWTAAGSALLSDQPARAIATLDPIPGSAAVLATTRDGAVRRVEVGGGVEILPASNRRLRAAALDASGRWLAIAPESGPVEIYEVGQASAPIARLDQAEGGVMDLAFTASGTLRTLSGAGELREWPWPTPGWPALGWPNMGWPTMGYAGRAPGLVQRVGPAGVLTLDGSQARLYRLGEGGFLTDSGLRVNDAIAMDMDSAGRRVVLTNAAGELWLYEQAEETWRATRLSAPPAPDPRLVGVRLSPDGRRVVAWGPLGTGLWAWVEAAGWSAAPSRLSVPGDSSRLLLDLAMDSRGQTIVAAEAGGLRVWALDARPGAEVLPLWTPDERASAVSVDPTGRWVALAREDGAVRRLELASRAAETVLPNAGARVVLALPDGAVLAAGPDGAALWTADDLARLPASGGAVAASATPDSVLVLGADGALWRWPRALDPASVRALLDARATACVPPERRTALTGEEGPSCDLLSSRP